MRIVVTGGAGFIGSALIRKLVSSQEHKVLNIDSLTYAGNLSSLKSVKDLHNYQFSKISINDFQKLRKIIFDFKPDSIMHLAAESHVDNSISGPKVFLDTNIFGTYNLLEVTREYLAYLPKSKKLKFRFQHISTDEVYGDLDLEDEPFQETTPYDPSSPYSASKASSDHLVRSWHRTFDIPTLITNCSNNYGEYQYPEKLIPKSIINAILGKEIPIYGDGKNIRDWLYVNDHVDALISVMLNGSVGQTYNIGGNNEYTNIDIINYICETLDEHISLKNSNLKAHSELIKSVKDREGHDKRYAINSSKIFNELGWKPQESFETGILKTVKWYIDNKWWWEKLI